jgi:Arc/MetJ-type ribon-helix-helix transcriptional regulator
MAQYGAMARRQTLIQLDDVRLAALDERAAASGRSRSDLVREAIDLLLGTGDAAAVDAAIVDGYARAPAPKRDLWAFEGALAVIKAEPWQREARSGGSSIRTQGGARSLS